MLQKIAIDSSASFCYYLLGYYIVYLPGDIYNNALAAAASEIAGVLFGGVLYAFLRAEKTFLISFLISVSGAFLILLLG